MLAGHRGFLVLGIVSFFVFGEVLELLELFVADVAFVEGVTVDLVMPLEVIFKVETRRALVAFESVLRDVVKFSVRRQRVYQFKSFAADVTFEAASVAVRQRLVLAEVAREFEFFPAQGALLLRFLVEIIAMDAQQFRRFKFFSASSTFGKTRGHFFGGSEMVT